MFFEAKFEKLDTVKKLKETISDLAHQVFACKNYSINFEENEVKVKKIEISAPLNKELVSSLAQGQDFDVVKVDNEECVGDVFDFEKRCVLVKLKKKKWFNDKSITANSYLVSDSFVQVTSEVVVRALRVEPCIHYNYKAATGAQLSIDEVNTQRNCHSCKVF
jgi:hypothetical protein